jgi:hypothetical protein
VRLRYGLIAIALLILPRFAFALPRFAARTSMRCLQCHVSPGGGGPRNAYGRMFGTEWLPLQFGEQDWIEGGEEEVVVPFDGAITEWLAVGADLRAVYALLAPEEQEVTSTFFLMQADLYHALRLGPHLSVVLDIGVYSGFEAWALLRPFPDLEVVDILVRAGRFFPQYGVRFDNHTVFTRERVGFGPGAQDTGLEVGLDSRYLAISLALLNGTVGDVFDLPKQAHRSFDKAALGRLELRVSANSFRLSAGGSFYYNRNFDRASPLFFGQVDPMRALEGLDEIRAGGFLTLNLGRFTLLGEAAWVRDDFYAADVETRTGLATYAELNAVLLQGFEVQLGWEVSDPNLSVRSRLDHRFSVSLELFPIVFTELRAMARHQFGSSTVTDFLVFLHIFL